MAQIARTVGAQILTIGEERGGPVDSRSAAQAPPSVALSIVPPNAIATPVDYPAGTQGEALVVLELTIGVAGQVGKARVIIGETPFKEKALEAVKDWTFEPARRGAEPVASKIRFSVRFTPPATPPSELPQTPTSSGSSTPPSASRTPPLAPREILVIGQREPLKVTLGHAEVHDMPGAFGDPYRAIEGLPGVVPIVSGLPYFYVRGAPPGNVGYYFDGIPVPYLYHFAAGPSVLQPAFVDHVDLYPGAYPARYGRFAGAIVAGEMAPPSYRFHGEASIRLVDSGATIEAPFAAGRGSAMIGGRFSYTGAALSLIQPDISLNYWDYQGRVRYDLDPKNSVELLAFGAGDFLSDEETEYRSSSNADGSTSFSSERRRNTIVDVNFHRLDLRWDHRLEAGNWRSALMLGLDRTGGDQGNVAVKNRMIGARSEFHRTLDRSLLLRGGGDVLFESLSQQVNDGTNGEVSSIGSSSSKDSRDFGFDAARRDLTAGAWTDLVWTISPKLEITPGIRADLFVSGGTAALAIDPRISARYTLSKQLSVTHGFALVHQAPSFVVPVPGFKPSLKGGLQTALQSSSTIAYSLPSGFESSLGVFQNAFFDMTDLISLAQLQNTTGKDEKDFRATGHAYGVELMLRRSLARNVGGFVSYTLSRSTRSDGNLEGPATTDRTHVLNIALSGNLGRNWRLGGRWLFYSGIPAHVAYIQAAQAPPRTPPFWRLDFKLQKRWYIKSPDAWWGVVFEVLNTTLNKEVLNGNCSAFTCNYESIGPVTIPSIGAEGAF